jgi:hypothetical protein
VPIATDGENDVFLWFFNGADAIHRGDRGFKAPAPFSGSAAASKRFSFERISGLAGPRSPVALEVKAVGKVR